MEANSTQQEIILIAGTNLSNRKFFEGYDECDYQELTAKEKLKLACRNGLLPAILPEIFEPHSANKKLYLWEMSEDSLFVELKLGEVYLDLEMEYSIDPYSFLAIQILS